jgi:hypothetical protein
MGMRFLVTNTDSNMIFQSASRDVSTIREFTGGSTD